ncbi:hypothetical protein [Niabella hibiscisoli]|uniref:hypothetical protein n=1 Tax=Niabella hibiscisoli TaxID=1825928 RepID=UPI001F0F9B4A|nr:hypothetical protein [Niabella hibiscisoli]MCH5716912.1 hypothetical protein [Niabella hibiscisoli]
MNVEELKTILKSLNVPDQWYAINDGLKADALILYENYKCWELFYYSERGDRLDHKVFETEEEACLYLLERIKTQASFLKR